MPSLRRNARSAYGPVATPHPEEFSLITSDPLPLPLPSSSPSVKFGGNATEYHLVYLGSSIPGDFDSVAQVGAPTGAGGLWSWWPEFGIAQWDETDEAHGVKIPRDPPVNVGPWTMGDPGGDTADNISGLGRYSYDRAGVGQDRLFGYGQVEGRVTFPSLNTLVSGATFPPIPLGWTGHVVDLSAEAVIPRTFSLTLTTTLDADRTPGTLSVYGHMIPKGGSVSAVARNDESPAGWQLLASGAYDTTATDLVLHLDLSGLSLPAAEGGTAWTPDDQPEMELLLFSDAPFIVPPGLYLAEWHNGYSSSAVTWATTYGSISFRWSTPDPTVTGLLNPTRTRFEATN